MNRHSWLLCVLALFANFGPQSGKSQNVTRQQSTVALRFGAACQFWITERKISKHGGRILALIDDSLIQTFYNMAQPRLEKILESTTTNEQVRAVNITDTPTPTVPNFKNWTVRQIIGYSFVAVLVVALNAAIGAYSDHPDVVKPMSIAAAGLGFITAVLSTAFAVRSDTAVKTAKNEVNEAIKGVALQKNVVNKMSEVAEGLFLELPDERKSALLQVAQATAGSLHQPVTVFQADIHRAASQPAGAEAVAPRIDTKQVIKYLTLNRIV